MRENWHINNSLEKRDSKWSIEHNIYYNKGDGALLVLLDGYVLPRMQYYDELCHLPPLELIKHLRQKYGKEFIHYLKGIFCIVIIENNDFEIYTDIHGIQNFFVYKKDEDFIISNSLDYIAQKVKLEQDFDNATTFALLSHYIADGTMFKHVYNSEAGSFVEYRNGVLSFDYYWKPEGLFDKNRKLKKYNEDEFADLLRKLTEQYLNYLQPKDISLTITSGNDSRMVLAALLSLKVYPHTFTFGNPKSFESIISAEVAKVAGLNHKNHFIETPNPSWLHKHATKLIDIGGSLISFMRAHRFDAYKMDKTNYPDTEMIFTGLMGGEYLKMPPPYTPTLPILLLDVINANSDEELHSLLVNRIKQKGFLPDKVNVERVHNNIKKITDRTKGLSPRERSFVLHFLYYGCAHHSQEAKILQYLYKYPVHLFMDVDLLCILATSVEWYPNSNSRYNRFTHSKFMISITHKLAPQLSKVPYGKKGKYTAEDILYRPLRYYVKRMRYLIIKENKKYPPGFFMGAWLFEFCNEYLENKKNHIEHLYNMEWLIEKNNSFARGTGEYNWEYITNAINLDMIKEKYLQ